MKFSDSVECSISAERRISSYSPGALQELGEKAVYLRYELGMFHFIAMEWPKAHEHFSCVYNSVNSDKVFFPYRSLVTTQLAAVAFSMGENEQGERLCKDMFAAATGKCRYNDTTTFYLPGVRCYAGLEYALEARVRLCTNSTDLPSTETMAEPCKHMRLLAFEVMYFLRQFPKVPGHMLLALKESVRKATKPVDEDAEWLPESENDNDSCIVEMASALTIQVVICFYLGDAEAAMVFIPDLSQLCPRLPGWATYLSAHGLYWQACFQQAKSYKKYPFNISVKISKVLAEHEEQMAQQEELTSSAC
eukprot:s1502_g3.t1